MRKIILVLSILLSGLTAKPQLAGYTPIADLPKFKEQFAVIAKKTETIKSDFTQEKNLSMLSEKIVSKGKFWFKKDNLLRMEYTKPYQYLMILNKDNMYIKDGQKENKVSTKSNKLFQQINKITIDCVQGTVFNNPDFITKVYENKSTYLVELSPIGKALKEFFKSINVIIDKSDYEVTTIEMNENSGDNTIIRFTNREINTIIPDAIFAIK
ncbi:LolA family protein [Mucilaginibacter sp. E4BP6]|uniref:LolA family protein n=1 Tax=Mucilaginibacter sp. E4BP6 TaxID=2723089 RepID=UPI0015C71EDC|nr:outer membrane lipoprotein carrier protein LolA [Mucilaginibacter sp. E4BP6]NYE64403.1 outer membrane lipoprotein-sorting protein [Mucilaginibacter sp. E4BP6]